MMLKQGLGTKVLGPKKRLENVRQAGRHME